MTEAITLTLMVIGTVLCLLAALGLIRMPDVYSRMQVGTKATTLGVGCLLAAVAVHFGDLGITTRSVLIIVFLLLTAPIAAHMIARAAYLAEIPLWERSVVDELQADRAKATAAAAPADPPAAEERRASDVDP